MDDSRKWLIQESADLMAYGLTPLEALETAIAIAATKGSDFTNRYMGKALSWLLSDIVLAHT